MAAMGSKRALAAVFILCASLAVLSYGAGSRPLMEPSEGRYGSIAAEMERSGDYLVPRINGSPHLEKPPLAIWLMAASLDTLGESEGSLRLPGVLAGAACVLLAYLLAGPEQPARALLAAGLVAVAPLHFALSRFATTDIYLAGCVALTLYFACRALERADEPARAARLMTLAALASALGFLAKGPAVWLFTLVPLVLEGALSRRKGTLRRILAPRNLCLFAAVVLPWFLLLERRLPGSLAWFCGQRAVGALVSSEHFHRGPVYYFVPVLLAGLFPAAPILLGSGRTAWAEILAPGPRRLLALSVAIPFLVFSLSASKLATYLLPAALPVAVLAAHVIVKGRGRGAVLVCCLALAAAPAVPLLLPDGRAWVEALPLQIALECIAVLFLALLGGLTAAQMTRFDGARVGLGVLLVFQLFVLLVCARIASTPGNGLGRHDQSQEIAAEIRAQAGADEPVLCYRSLVFGLPFYLGHAVLSTERHTGFGKGGSADVDPTGDLAALVAHGPVLVVCPAKHLQDLQAQPCSTHVLWQGRSSSLVRAWSGGAEPNPR